jgi:hypothetical protein
MQEKRKIVLKDILAMLEEGKSRKEINEYYELNPREAKVLWANPKLKGVKKAKYSIGFELVEEATPSESGLTETLQRPYIPEQDVI